MALALLPSVIYIFLLKAPITSLFFFIFVSFLCATLGAIGFGVNVWLSAHHHHCKSTSLIYHGGGLKLGNQVSSKFLSPNIIYNWLKVSLPWESCYNLHLWCNLFYYVMV